MSVVLLMFLTLCLLADCDAGEIGKFRLHITVTKDVGKSVSTIKYGCFNGSYNSKKPLEERSLKSWSDVYWRVLGTFLIVTGLWLPVGIVCCCGYICEDDEEEETSDKEQNVASFYYTLNYAIKISISDLSNCNHHGFIYSSCQRMLLWL